MGYWMVFAPGRSRHSRAGLRSFGASNIKRTGAPAHSMMRSSSAQPSSKNPLVSIGLPTRNRAHLLKEALESLLGQTYRNIEYIVSDNASTDGTAELLHDYAARDPRIRYIRQDTDINGMENHEFVLRKAQGEYFMWASDDDWWHPRFVETLVDVLEKN